MPGLRCVAGEVGSDDLDVERVLKEFAAKLKLLMSRHGSSGGQTFDQDMDNFEGWQSLCQQRNCRTN